MDKTVTDCAGKPAEPVEQTSDARSPDSATAVAVPPAREEGSSRSEWTGHPVNIRLTIPLPFRSYYLTIVAGPERRSKERRGDERKKHPLLTIGNVIVYLAAGSLCGLAALALIQVVSAHALSSGSLATGLLVGLFLLAVVVAYLWLFVRRLLDFAHRVER